MGKTKLANKLQQMILKEYGNDPLYKNIIFAESKVDLVKDIETCRAIRGETAYNNFLNRVKYLSLLKG